MFQNESETNITTPHNILLLMLVNCVCLCMYFSFFLVDVTV